MSLEPIDAETALELYLADKENELSEASLKATSTGSVTSSAGATRSRR